MGTKFFGKLFDVDETRISVDYFRNDTMYQLISHAHSDHIQGYRDDCHYTIVCTHATKQLLLWLLSNPGSCTFIVLELGKTVDLEGISVTALPVTHCLGACMFLVDGVLYAGDGRDFPLATIEQFPVSDCYFDSTFLRDNETPSPPLHAVVAEMMRYLSMPAFAHHIVFFSTPLPRLGHEIVYRAVYKTFHQRVFVHDLEFYDLLYWAMGDASGATDDPTTTRFTTTNGVARGRAQPVLCVCFQPTYFRKKPPGTMFEVREDKVIFNLNFHPGHDEVDALLEATGTSVTNRAYPLVSKK